MIGRSETRGLIVVPGAIFNEFMLCCQGSRQLAAPLDSAEGKAVRRSVCIATCIRKIASIRLVAVIGGLYFYRLAALLPPFRGASGRWRIRVQGMHARLIFSATQEPTDLLNLP